MTRICVVLAIVGCTSEGVTNSPPSLEAQLDGGTTDPIEAAVAAVDGATPAADPITPADLGFKAIAQLPQGEFLVASDWTPKPNEFFTLSPDGKDKRVIFRVTRLWAFGVDSAGAQVAFSSNDPFQKKRYPDLFDDSVQHTWLYDADGQTIRRLSFGNVNDECFRFHGDRLWLCRRWDFGSDQSFKGYRLGHTDLEGKAFAFAGPESPMSVGPEPIAGTSRVLFWSTGKAGSDLEELDTTTSKVRRVRSKASRPVVSPDGTKVAYLNHGATPPGLFVADLATFGSANEGTRVTSIAAKRATWSPDGTRLAYLRDEPAKQCNHIEITAADGSTQAMPTRVLDCNTAPEFVAGLAWVKRP